MPGKCSATQLFSSLNDSFVKLPLLPRTVASAPRSCSFSSLSNSLTRSASHISQAIRACLLYHRKVHCLSCTLIILKGLRVIRLSWGVIKAHFNTPLFHPQDMACKQGSHQWRISIITAWNHSLFPSPWSWILNPTAFPVVNFLLGQQVPLGKITKYNS